MKEQWKRFADRIDGMTLRERGMIFVMVAVVLLAVLNSVLLDPLFAKQKLLSQRIEQQQGETKSLGIQIQGLVQARGQDPDAANHARLQVLKQQIEEIDAALQAKQEHLVPPGRIALLLEQILNRK